MPVDLDTFKPESAEDFASAIVQVVVGEVKDLWNEAKDTLLSHITALATAVAKTQERLISGVFSEADADYAIHQQELYFNNILLLSEFLPYVLAQRILNGVFTLINAAIKNVTGIDLGFGK